MQGPLLTLLGIMTLYTFYKNLGHSLQAQTLEASIELKARAKSKEIIDRADRATQHHKARLTLVK